MNPQHQFVGPIYCDTAHMWMGFHEPVNTVTNLFIFIAAWLAYRYVRRSRVPMDFGLVLLLFLLTMTAVGSTLWHGLRTRWALQLDWMPGVAFLLVLSALWCRRLTNWAVGIFLAVLMLVAAVGSVIGAHILFPALADAPPNLRFTPAFAAITLFAAAMIFATWKTYGREAGRLGVVLVCCALLAAVFRSIDLIVCPFIPFGTHFLWHLLLSTASCLGIVLMVKMKKKANSE